jgi:carbon monoxide dehydrogenase subunit G
VGRTVGIVHAQGRVHDEGHGSRVQVIFGVQDAPRLTDIQERGVESRARLLEERIEVREQAAEIFFPENKALADCIPGAKQARAAQCHDARAERSEKRPPIVAA